MRSTAWGARHFNETVRSPQENDTPSPTSVNPWVGRKGNLNSKPEFSIGMQRMIRLTDKVLLQPFNESERQRADYLGCQQQPLLGCGPATCRPLGAAPKPGPRRKLRATSHLSKSMSSTPSHQN